MKYLLLGLVHIYRIFLKPFFGGRCRFVPTCSEYALESLKKYGSFKGSFLIIKRLCKCHPFHKGGVDNVP